MARGISMVTLRRAACAGRWYPDDPGRLAAQLDRFLAVPAAREPGQTLRALVVPHAGLSYSGPVAAHAYKLLGPGACDAIALVGPSHFVAFRGVSVWPRGAWQTPFGPLAVDEPLATALLAASPLVIEHPEAHLREHSLEMQMPFLGHLMPGVPVVPLLMGAQTRTTAFGLGDALADVILESARRVLLVASSDLSHYENARTAAALDGAVMARVQALDGDGLMTLLEREPRHACGGGAMVAVLRAARRLGATHARLLQYGDSGDVSGDKDSVVGYMAAAIW